MSAPGWTTAPPTQPLSVCLISGEYPPAVGGLADYSRLLAEHLSSAGLAVTVVTAGPTAPEPGAAGPPVRRVSGWGLAAATEWARQVADADVVHLQYQTAAFGLSPVVNLLPALLRHHGIRAPVITTFHDLRTPYLFRGAGRLRLRPLVNYLLMGASAACIFTDPADLARAHPRRPAAWIPIGPNVSPTAPVDGAAARARQGIGPDEAVVAYFGFLNASKGVDVLLRAAQRLVRGGVELRLLFVGDAVGASDPTDVATAAASRRLAADLDLEERILRTGPLRPGEVSAALAAADLAALPFADGASLRRGSLLTCLAHGLPVVTTHPTPQPDVPRRHRVRPFDDPAAYRLDAGVAALVPAGDDAALARELYRLLNDPGRREQLGQAGQAFASQLTWPAIAQATATVYRSVRREH